MKSIFIKTLAVAALLSLSFAGTPDVAEAQVFHSVRSLLGSEFQNSDNISFVRVSPTGAQRGLVERRLGRGLDKDEYVFYIATSNGQVDGYALFDQERGQHELIDFATFFDPHGNVTRVEVVAYREPYGEGIRAERFRRQFVGRNADSGFRSGRDIDVISGATLSTRAMSRAVQRATLLLHETVLASDGALAHR